MGAAPPGVRGLFRAALILFVITVVIGILNGIDVWEPQRNTLLTHVHAGTLGWITLAVFGAAIWMFGSPEDRSAVSLSYFSIAGVALYVLAFWSVDLTTTSIQRAIGGTLAFLAMSWMFVWAWRRMLDARVDVARLGMILLWLSWFSERCSVCCSAYNSPMSRSSIRPMPTSSTSPILERWWLAS